MNKIMARKTFIRYAQQASMICIPIRTGRGDDYSYVELDKKSFLHELSEHSDIESIEFDQIRDTPDSIIWLHTPDYSGDS